MGVELRAALAAEVKWCRDEARKIDDVARDWGEKEFPAGEAQAYAYVAERLSRLLLTNQQDGGEQ